MNYKLSDNFILNEKEKCMKQSNAAENGEKYILSFGEYIVVILLQEYVALSSEKLQSQFLRTYDKLQMSAENNNLELPDTAEFIFILDNLVQKGFLCESTSIENNDKLADEVDEYSKMKLNPFSDILSSFCFLVLSILSFTNGVAAAGILFMVAMAIPIYSLVKKTFLIDKRKIIKVTAICTDKKPYIFGPTTSCNCEFEVSEHNNKSVVLILATTMLEGKVREGKKYNLFFKKGRLNEDGNFISQENFVDISRY